MPSVVGALTASPSIRSTPNSRCAAVTGMCTSASRLTPNAEPTFSKTPITRNRTPAMVTCRPSGSTSPKTASRDVASRAPPPGDGCRRRSPVMYSPRASGRSNTSGTFSLTPLTVANDLALRRPATVSPRRDRRRDAGRGRRPRGRAGSTSSSCSRLTDGAEPNSNSPGHDEDEVRAESLDLGLDLLLGAAADGDQDHDGRDADDDAEHGQHAAQPVGPQRVERDPERLAGPHARDPPWCAASRCRTRSARPACGSAGAPGRRPRGRG